MYPSLIFSVNKYTVPKKNTTFAYWKQQLRPVIQKQKGLCIINRYA